MMTWGKFVCVYLRVDGFWLVSYKDASSRLQTFLYFLELGGTIYRMELLSIASMTSDRPAAAAQPWVRLELPQ